jgi:hypothetical protein
MSSARQAAVFRSTLPFSMKGLPASALLALLLTHCTARLPEPGKPVRTDIDQRWEQRQQDRNEDEPQRTAEQQAAFDAGYAAGHGDARRGKPADPDAHDDYRATPLRTHFLDGYEEGIHPASKL